MPHQDEHARPNPDVLLEQVKQEEARQTRGRLKIFFGGAAGVGKTFAMLSDARSKAVEGVDVVVGYAEPHARPETEELLLGLDILPVRRVEYRGTTLKELDLPSALSRRPELLLVDELAHTNAAGSRHAKRWQDIEELLQAGIDVYTTLNVQHLESLNDVVAQITGVVVRETLPDAVFENADEVELVDLPPDELLERLAEGKVYIPQQAAQAIHGFFRKPNLTALRELALRKVAERVHVQVQDARAQSPNRRTWATAERLLVCITPQSSSARIIRAAKRMATALRSEWIVTHTETPRFRDAVPAEHDMLQQHFRLAERLGAETVTLSGLNPADEIVNYARQRNVTKIIFGKNDRPWWYDLLARSTGDQILRKSGDIDVYIIGGLPSPSSSPSSAPYLPDNPLDASGRSDEPPPYYFDLKIWRDTFITLLLCTGVAGAMYYGLNLQKHGDLSNLVMIYLVGVVVVAARYGRLPSVVAALISVAFFDFVFVPPRFTFAVADTQYLITFLVMLGVALVIGTLTVRIREQADSSRKRERRTEALYRMTEQLAATSGITSLCETAIGHLQEIFQSRAAIFMTDDLGKLSVRSATDDRIGQVGHDMEVAQWVFEHRQIAGRGTDTLPAAEALYLPLVASRGSVGVVAIDHPQANHLLAPEQRLVLDAFIDQIALALERDQLTQSARKARLEAETENLRSSLLSSVSHDLRTPLAIISGASMSLLENHVDPQVKNEWIHTIHEESERLTRLVSNLLDMTRLEAGAVTLNKEWQPIEEVIGSALRRLQRLLGNRPVKTSLADHLPMVEIDGVLLEQVLVNLLENALKYTPAGSELEITAALSNQQMVVEVRDQGSGLMPGEESRIFEKFYRGNRSQGQRGSGLGLPICRAIVEAHGGQMQAVNRPAPEHGAVFRLTIPLSGSAPPVYSDES